MNNDLSTAELAALGVATLYEAAGRSGLVNIPLIPVVLGSRAAGPARTVKCGSGDNLMVHAAMEELQPGEVLVLTSDTPEPVALVGELLAMQAKYRGAAAILVDGAVRDMEELARLELPIWARYIRASGATKQKIGALGTPVTVGGAEIRNGDFVILDADGAVCVPVHRLRKVVVAARVRIKREQSLKDAFAEGKLSLDLHDLRPLLERERP